MRPQRSDTSDGQRKFLVPRVPDVGVFGLFGTVLGPPVRRTVSRVPSTLVLVMDVKAPVCVGTGVDGECGVTCPVVESVSDRVACSSDFSPPETLVQSRVCFVVVLVSGLHGLWGQGPVILTEYTRVFL